MSANLAELIDQIDKHARAERHDAALVLANDLVAKYPNESEVWAARAYLHARYSDYQRAVADLDQAIAIQPMEPVLYHDRGRYKVRLADVEGAILDFSKTLELCDHYGNDYYREDAHFLRAEAYLRLGNKDLARADLAYVRDDYTMWTTRLRTKHELVAECAN